MLSAAILGAVFLTGLLGGVHCAGMCGGIVTALAGQSRQNGRPAWWMHLSYNAGRIASYGIAGALVGAAGGLPLLLDGILPVQLTLYLFANVLLIALGLYLAGISSVVTRLEPIGAAIWRRVQPFTGRFLPANTPAKALALGMLWGWLPCGLVYAILTTALLSGHAVSGAAIMLAFGLGTLPNLMAAGLLYRRFGALARAKPMRALSGALVLGFGVYGIAHAATLSQHIKAGWLCGY
jgi:sulfite exporter TauE/SafE